MLVNPLRKEDEDPLLGHMVSLETRNGSTNGIENPHPAKDGDIIQNNLIIYAYDEKTHLEYVNFGFMKYHTNLMD